MIFYFSGTGNSLYVAKKIAKKQGVNIVDMAEALQKKQLIYVPEDGEIVGFVFPIYAWAPPRIVLDFINKVQIARKNNYMFSVCTCGAEAGNAVDILRTYLMKNQMPLNADFSVVMPDNYILMYNIDTPQKQKELLEKADEKLIHINETISKCQNVSESERGKFAVLKTNIISRLFNKFGNPARRFSSTSACNSCGFCVKICPYKNITITKQRKPVWGDKCTSCLACLHRCPKAAIECGIRTINKQRYYNPNCDKIDDKL